MAEESINFLPFVSIVVPVYNGERTIKNCLGSIMKLKYPREKLEVILVDDESTDETVNMAKKYPAKLIQKKHSGYPSTMNAGIKEAQGEIIVNVDSDTYIYEDWLIKVIPEFNDPKVGIVSGYVVTAPTRKFLIKMVGFEAEDSYDKIESKYVDFITSTCTAYRREVFSEVGLFDEKILWNCDEELSHRALKSGWKIVLLKDAMCCHDWNRSLKEYLAKQIITARFFVTAALGHSELLRGKKVHPLTLYIPLILTFFLILAPILLLISHVWISAFSLLGFILYHIPKTARIIRKHKDWTMVFFPIAILVRYVAWLVGIAIGILQALTK